MSSMLDALLSQFGGNALSSLSEQIGADPATTQGAVSAALPMLLGALGRNAAQPGGADALHQALGQHDGGILDNLAGALASPQVADDGSKILGHVLGGRQDAAASALGQVSGLSADQGGQLLALLAPVVMGLIGRHVQQGGLNASSLAGLLGQQGASAVQGMPAQHSLLASILDANADGSVADDVGRIGLGLLGKFLKR